MENPTSPSRPRSRANAGSDVLPAEATLLSEFDLPGRKPDPERRSVREWFELVFPASYYSPSVRERACKALVDETQRATGYSGMVAPDVSTADQAGIWNRAMRALGYDVPEYLCVVIGPRPAKKRET